jgi:hypothetical protein
MKVVRFLGVFAAGLFSSLLISSPALPGQAKPPAPVSSGPVNLYQDVATHQGAITWMTASAPTIPDDVCKIFKTCSNGTPKAFVLPAATLGGVKTGRALFLVPTKDAQHPDVVLEDQTTSAAYFFLLGQDGSLNSTAYLEAGKPWYHIANSLAQNKFDRDVKDWHDWASKLPAKKP